MATLRKAITRVLICFFLPQLLFVGCSLIGAGFGANASRDDPTNITLLQAGAVKEGKYLLVRKIDNSELRGVFLKISAGDEASFTQRYLTAGNIDYAGVLPHPGDSLEFTYGIEGGRLIGRGRSRGLETKALLVNRATSLYYHGVIAQPGDSLVLIYAVKGGRLIRRCRFGGAEAGALILSRTTSFPDSSTRIAIDSLSSLHVVGRGDVNLAAMRSLILWESKVVAQPDTVMRIAFDDLGTLHVEGKGDVNLVAMSASIFTSMDNYVLATTQLVLRDGADTVYVPVSDIASIEVEGTHYAWLMGLAAGAVVDLMLILTIGNDGNKGCGKIGGSNSAGCESGRIVEMDVPPVPSYEGIGQRGSRTAS